MELKGRCALVTGASRGIGRAIAVALAKKGADVAVNYIDDEKRVNRSDALEVVREIEAVGGKGVAVEADVSVYGRVLQMAGRISREFGVVDILVNNAAILADRTLKKMSEQEWRAVIDVNLTGVFNCSRVFIEGMIEKQRGSIVNMSSISGYIGFWGQTNYAAAKAGVAGFTRSLAREVAAKNITVNAIAPGIVETDMAGQIPENVRQEFLKQIPAGRFAVPAEIADLALFLVSGKADYITGQTIHINGGWAMT